MPTPRDPGQARGPSPKRGKPIARRKDNMGLDQQSGGGFRHLPSCIGGRWCARPPFPHRELSPSRNIVPHRRIHAGSAPEVSDALGAGVPHFLLFQKGLIDRCIRDLPPEFFPPQLGFCGCARPPYGTVVASFHGESKHQADVQAAEREDRTPCPVTASGLYSFSSHELDCSTSVARCSLFRLARG